MFKKISKAREKSEGLKQQTNLVKYVSKKRIFEVKLQSQWMLLVTIQGMKWLLRN